MDEISIRTILNEQRKEIEYLDKQDLITREFSDKRRSLLKSPSAKLIFGIRRSGKSTLAHQMLSDRTYAYINFDDERLVGIKGEDLGDLFYIAREIAGNPDMALLDEIQNIPGWELFVNRIQRKRINLLITGSSANLLSTELSTHLTGRYLPIILFTFSFGEFLTARKRSVPEVKNLDPADITDFKKLSEEYLRGGGFPVATLDPGNRDLYLNTLYDDIINKDVIGRFKPKYVRTLRELALFLISSSSNLMTYSSIRKRFEIGSTNTVKNYIGYLVDASLLIIVEKFTFRQRERSSSPKKVYCMDTGFVEILSSSPGDHISGLLENAVFLELLRRTKFEPTVSVNYWRDYQDHEVDFVKSRNRKVEQLVQVSAISDRSDIRKRELRSLVKGARELKCNDLLLITWSLEGEIEEGGMQIKLLPFWKWALYK
jgi:hypothetical protein